jgi:hypothetical protein
MLAFTVRVVAGTTHSFKPTERLLRVYLMTVSEGQKAASDFLKKTRVITVRFEHPQRAFIRHKCNRRGFPMGVGSLGMY